MPIKATIGGVDVSTYLKGLSASPGGDGVVGNGTLILDQQAGGLDLRPMMDVRVWVTFNAAGSGVAASGRLFGGIVGVRDTGAMGTTKLWALRCYDYNVLLHKIVRDASAAKAITLTAGTFAAQVIQLTSIIQLNGFGAVNTQIDATTGVASLYATMPAVTYEGGHPWGWYIQQLCNTAQSLNTALIPHFYMGTDTAFGVGATFGNPVLYVYNGASLPAIGLSFSDVVAGGRKGIYGTFRRTTDPTAMVQRRQAFFSDAHTIVTSQNATSQSTYPNPYINNGGTSNTGYWGAEVIEDSASSTFAEAQAALDRRNLVESSPVDTFEFETEERVQPGDMIGLGWSLEGIADDTPYRVAKVSTTIEGAEVVNSRLTVNSRRLGLFDDGQAVFAPPIEGDNVAPLPPASFSITSNTFNGTNTTMVFAIGASPSPDVVSYAVVGRVGHLVVNENVGTNLTPTLYFQSGQTYNLQAVALDRDENQSEGTPTVALTGTTAQIAPVLAAPGSLTETSNQYNTLDDLSQVAFSWTAPADPNAIGIGGYKVIRTQNGLPTVFLIGVTLAVNLLMEPGVAYKVDVNAIDGYGRDGAQATIVGTAAARVHEQLYNPSFEVIERAPQPVNPRGWTLSNGTGSGSLAVWDNTTASEGARSIKFEHPNAGTGPSAVSEFFRIDEHKTYFIESDVKGSAADANGPQFDFVLYDAAFSGLTTYSGGFNPLTTSWAANHALGGIAPPAGSRYAKVTVKWGGAPRVLTQRIDNLRVRAEVVGDDVKDATVPSAKLATTGVTAATYKLPTVVFNAQGQATSATDRAGASFPGSPSTDDFFYRTDLGVLCRYDGSRWLGPQQSIPFSHRNTTQPFTVNGDVVAEYRIRASRTIYLKAWAINTHVTTLCNSSNFWTVALLKASDASDITTKTTASDAANTWVQQTEITSFTGNPYTYAGIQGFAIQVRKTGSPGGIYLDHELLYHEVYT